MSKRIRIFEWVRGLSPPGYRRSSGTADRFQTPLCEVALRGSQIIGIGPRRAPAGDLAGRDWTAAVEKFGIAPDELADRVTALVEHGVPFRCCATSPSLGLLRVTGQTAGIEALLVLAHCTPLERDLHTQLKLQSARLREMRDAGTRAESCPVPAIETDSGGRIVWHNPAADRLLRRGINRVTLSRLEPGVRGARTQLLGSDGQAIGWARATTAPVPGGGKITHLEDIDAQIAAESDLESFMATLTETFAHLEQGLGIFDRDRKLTLFNPALSQMFSLDPAVLARRPSLRHFLEALRQHRMVPEQRDYTRWRTRFIESSTATGAAPFAEDWPLPSGQTLRVSVRRHPHGALAFIFKDISTQVMLESRYRAEIETTQATLDKLAEAVAVVGASGQITYANPAFASALDLDAMDGLSGHTIDTICDAARRCCRGIDSSWHALRRYILSSERDAAWQSVAYRRSGGTVLMRACALPDGSTLLTLMPLVAAADFDADADAAASAEGADIGLLRA